MWNAPTTSVSSASRSRQLRQRNTVIVKHTIRLLLNPRPAQRKCQYAIDIQSYANNIP